MTETSDTHSDTMDLINQDHPITTRNELAKAIKDLKTNLNKIMLNQNQQLLLTQMSQRNPLEGDLEKHY